MITNREYFFEVLIFPELVAQLLEEVLFPAEVVGHNTQYIDVPVIAVGFESKAAEDFHAKANLLEVNDLVVSRGGSVDHPPPDDIL